MYDNSKTGKGELMEIICCGVLIFPYGFLRVDYNKIKDVFYKSQSNHQEQAKK